MDGPGATVHKCTSYEACAAAEYYELSELPQVIFYATLLDEVEKLDVLHGPRLRSLEVALTELHWRAIESWIWLFGDRIYEAQFRPKSGRARTRGPVIVGRARVREQWPTGWPLRVYAYILSKHYLLYIISSSGSSSGDVRGGQAGPQVEGRHLYEYSSTPSILSPQVKVTYPWEITIANYVPDFQVRKMVKMKSTPQFPGAPTRSDLQDGPGSHFPNPKGITKLKRSVLEKQYLLPAEYSFVIPEPDATVNEPPSKCIPVYRAALNYDLHFPLHPVTKKILNKCELAPAQFVPTSWNNICSFIATCELRGLT
ncbi:hypothetical protein Cgig2_027118 [Carnegiea gigantea]|uniref:Uncharacterized protein n=1 Tax=Carnegiea gigantea TaxID=171969 RepID=A0A9Q1GIG8_9CARY|nr:hypothetical protein Cgig2_027118 [Carnegiea gigantea]